MLILDVVGSSIVGNVTNPFGVFPLSGTVHPNGEGVFKIGRFAATIRFSGTKFEANYANDCGGRFAIGRKLAVGKYPRSAEFSYVERGAVGYTTS
jgi:hypothetical protein